jgi:signal transduction histidine kinase
MCPAPKPGQYYLSHRLPITGTAASAEDEAEAYYLSIVDRHGSVLKTIAGESPVRDMWLGPYPKTGKSALYVSPINGRMLAYSPDLQLLAASDTIAGPVFVTWLRIAGRSDSVIALNDGIYDQNLHKLLHFSRSANAVEAVALDSMGRASAIAIGFGSGGTVADIHRQDFFKLVSIFYVHHQSYILSGLLGLLAVLVVVNYYRRRTKQNLITITRQKKELETAHQALRDAQAKLVQQEKYKQARDIAGGFAHEIRNALFPAEAALTRLKQMPNGGDADSQKTRKYVGSVNRAVDRAIGITEIISRYTRLGSESQPANVELKPVIDEVLTANADRVDDQGCTIEVKGQTDVHVVADHDQLVMALNNLVRNSLDALVETSDPHICLSVETDGDAVSLSVTDNGAGIPDDIKERVFDAFFSTKPDTGTGLGLSVVTRILDMYDGTLDMKSVPGEETTFTIRLKRADRMAPS